MVMRAEDLATLFTPPPGADVSYRQGVITAWDPIAKTNQVMIGGALIDNVPTLTANGAAVLGQGDTVMLLRTGRAGAATFFILGKIEMPGTTSPQMMAGWLGWGDVTYNQWPSTTGTQNDDELLVGQTQRRSRWVFLECRTYISANTTGRFRLTIDGVEMANSGTLDGTSAGAIGNFDNLVAWPDSVGYYDVVPIAITGKVLSGTGKVAATVREMYMV